MSVHNPTDKTLTANTVCQNGGFLVRKLDGNDFQKPKLTVSIVKVIFYKSVKTTLTLFGTQKGTNGIKSPQSRLK